MSHQGNIWEREYRNPKLVTKDDKPQADILRFLKFLKKEEKYATNDKNILDLGCGTGRNSNYLAELGNNVIGIEISKTAVNIAKERAIECGVKVDYRLGDIGENYEIKNESIDIVFDVTSSNSLDEKGRENYLREMSRVLRKGGFVFVRALCKDGDDNAKKLLKENPGEEYDTYKIKEMGLTERVFSRADFTATYGKYFEILKLEKITHYSAFNNRVYKRNYWLAYLKK